jgi:hypothetical protein
MSISGPQTTPSRPQTAPKEYSKKGISLEELDYFFSIVDR